MNATLKKLSIRRLDVRQLFQWKGQLFSNYRILVTLRNRRETSSPYRHPQNCTERCNQFIVCHGKCFDGREIGGERRFALLSSGLIPDGSILVRTTWHFAWSCHLSFELFVGALFAQRDHLGPIRRMTLGRARIRFFSSKSARKSATIEMKTPTGRMRVSSCLPNHSTY